MKFTWLTDIHINFLDSDERNVFYKKIIDANCDGVLITGDIAEADCVAYFLSEMQRAINKPIYFILGNHDFYRGQINNVHENNYSINKK